MVRDEVRGEWVEAGSGGRTEMTEKKKTPQIKWTRPDKRVLGKPIQTLKLSKRISATKLCSYYKD